MNFLSIFLSLQLKTQCPYLLGVGVVSSISGGTQTVDGTGIIEPDDIRKGLFTKVVNLIIKGTITQIADSSFYLHTSLLNVDIQGSLEIVGKNVFPTSTKTVKLGTSMKTLNYQCFYGSKLTEVHIPPSMITIDTQAFVGCWSLSVLVFDNITNSRLETIGLQCFRDSSILSLVLPKSLKYIGSGAFNSLKETTITLGPLVHTFSGSFSGSNINTLHIDTGNPNFIKKNGAIYTSNGDTLYAVESSNSPTVTVEPQTPYIGKYAFSYSKISEIIFAGTETILNENSFNSCKNLTQISLPASLITIKNSVFSGSGLQSLEIPKSVTSIGLSVFASCVDLTTISVHAENQNFKSDTQNMLYDKDYKYILFIPVKCQKTITLPATIKEISSYGFNKCEFEYLNLNEGLTIFAFASVYQCPYLKEITIPKSITYFQEASLSGNAQLEKIIFEPNSDCLETYLAFTSNPLLHTVDFGLNSQITKLSLFADCSKLKNIQIPASVIKIDAKCFLGCYELGSFELSSPNEITIGENAFYQCHSLENLRIDIPKVGDGAFNYCTGLKKLTISNRVTRIGANSFAKCGKLTEIIFENIGSSGLQRIEAMGFSECINIINITLPSNIEYFTASSFSFSSKLQNINLIPENQGIFRSIKGVVYKGTGEFQTFVACPNGRETITIIEFTRILGENSFTGCGNLKNVYFNPEIIEISEYCFSGCISLLELNIPTGIKKVGTKAFENCNSLNLIYFCANENNIYFIDSNPIPDFTKIIVKYSYKSDEFMNHPVIKSSSIDPGGCPILPSNPFSRKKNFDKNCVFTMQIFLLTNLLILGRFQ